MIEIKVPAVGESITEVTLVQWLKQDGEWVNRDELICELESEKATFELNAEQAGILHHVAQEGDTINIGDVACKIDTEAERPESAEAEAASTEESAEKSTSPESAPGQGTTSPPQQQAPAEGPKVETPIKATPVAKSIMADKQIGAAQIKGSGPLGRIMKMDVLAALENPGKTPVAELFSRNERTVKMSNLRKTISRRLVEAKNTTAMLTTFNEVDMTSIISIRKANRDKFKETHGVGLGFMSFFVKACTIALQEWEAVNAYLSDDSLIYHDYVDISIAVSAPKGLVVPVIRNTESLSMADIEREVINLATKARENKLTIEEMTGGTFTITNGGVFGSLMSTPIINMPQSAILGMHKIQERPMVVDGKIEIRPMMYLALSYDHRIIDGRESVGFLVRVKELLESPELMLFKKKPVDVLLEL